MSPPAYGDGSLYQRCEARFGCPAPVDGKRPPHKCEGRWYGAVDAGYHPNGTRRRLTVSAKTRQRAKRRLELKVAEVKAAGAPTKRTVTVAKWAETWLEDIETKVRPSSYSADKAAVAWIVGTIGHRKLADLTPADVRSVARALRLKGKSTSTALRYHGALHRMLLAADQEGYNIASNVLNAPKPTKAVNTRKAVTLADFVAALPHLLDRADGSRWVLAFMQGLRQAEALGLTWGAVDLDEGTLTISWQLKTLRYLDRTNPAAGFAMPDGYEARHLVGAYHLVRPKSQAGWRVIPLVPWAVTSLRAWRDIAPANPHNLVWPSVTEPAWPRNAANDRAEWVAIQGAAEIAHPESRPYLVHEIRHGTATLLMELGVPESVRVAIMGHSSIAVTHGYEHVDTRAARAALEQAAARLGLEG